MDEFHEWYLERKGQDSSSIEEIPFCQLDKWHIDEVTGDICHESGRFFSVVGVRFALDVGQSIKTWDQPMVNQPEFGVLGLLSKWGDGERRFLMQAKMEPGNINVVQLSPTVQATMSNFTRVHSGKKTDYLEYFTEAPSSAILVDSLQAEQGGRFYQKRNRNIVLEIDGDIEVKENYRWVGERELIGLLREDNLVNMNNRSVLSCYLSLGCSQVLPSMNSFERIISWLTQAKLKISSKRERIPLKEVSQWEMDKWQIRHSSKKYFSVVALRVNSNSREISSWTQPILKEPRRGFAGFLIKKFDGIDHYLVSAKIEPGNIDTIAMGPTVQYSYDNFDHSEALSRIFLNAQPNKIRYSARLSEEGGRFLNNQNDYMAVEVDEHIDVPENSIWVSYLQILQFIRYSLLNIEARTIIAGVNVGHELAGH